MVKLLEVADNPSCSTEELPANNNSMGASKTASILNGNSKVHVNGISKFNGPSTNKVTKVNDNSSKKLSNVETVNGNCDVQTDSRNSDDEVLGKEPLINGQLHNKDGEILLNGSNTPSEPSSSSSPEAGENEKVKNNSQEERPVQLLNGLSNSVHTEKIQNASPEESISPGLSEYLSKSRDRINALKEVCRKLSSDKNKNIGVNEYLAMNITEYCKNSKNNQPNGRSTHKIKNHEKESLPPQPPGKNPATIRNPGVSYSDALKNGTNKNSKSAITSGKSSGTQSPVEQLPTDSAKSGIIKNANLVPSNKSHKMPKSAEVSAWTDKIPSQNPPHESANSRNTGSLMPPTGNISPGKSYSSALRNGANVTSHSTHPNTSNCKKSDKTLAHCESTGMTNGESSKTCSSVEQSIPNGESSAIHSPIEQLLTEVTKTANNKIDVPDHPSDASEPKPLENPANNDAGMSPSQYPCDEPTNSVMDPGYFYNESTIAEGSESVISNDSGRGESETEILYDSSAPYCCEFPKEKTSQLIGRKGSFKIEIEKKSGVQFWVYQGGADTDQNIISMTGTGAQVEKAKNLIKQRFRSIELTQWHPESLKLSETYIARLPEGVDFGGVVSFFNSPHCFWVQQYAHPLLHQLQTLQSAMTAHFNSVTDAPAVHDPSIGSVVAVPGTRVDNRPGWIRGQITNLFPEINEAVVRYLDHGGDYNVPIDNLRQMRQEFFTMPFFAAFCCLYDIVPTTGSEWSVEAIAEFTRLCTCPNYVPIVRVIAKSPECYFVSIIAYATEVNQRVDVAAYLISKGLAARPQSPLYVPEDH